MSQCNWHAKKQRTLASATAAKRAAANTDSGLTIVLDFRDQGIQDRRLATRISLEEPELLSRRAREAQHI